MLKKWPAKWDQFNRDKLYKINPVVDGKCCVHFKNLWDHIIYTRCPVGHTRLTHKSLLMGEDPFVPLARVLYR